MIRILFRFDHTAILLGAHHGHDAQKEQNDSKDQAHPKDDWSEILLPLNRCWRRELFINLLLRVSCVARDVCKREEPALLGHVLVVEQLTLVKHHAEETSLLHLDGLPGVLLQGEESVVLLLVCLDRVVVHVYDARDRLFFYAF